MITPDTTEETAFDLSLIKHIPLTFAKTNMVLPVRRDASVLEGYVSDMQGAFALSEIAASLALKPKPILIDREKLLALINRIYAMAGSAAEVMDNMSEGDFDTVATEFESPKDIMELTGDAPIIRLLNALLQQAVKENASDIHIEPYENDLQVRMRIDGILRKILTPPKIIQDALISRVKIMANMDIAQRRLPQDGRIRLLISGKDIDVRVSIIPSVFGERAVLRILDRKQGLMGLSALGFDDVTKGKLETLLSRPHGIFLVTGPTGSGKTTTLYAALNHIYSEEKNIITIEDPVEYQIRGIAQIGVNTRIGLTFASGLRSVLRHDPDVIMVGEIRDFDTAEIAVQASLTGHLVLSTLHTNDAVSSVTRLIDMGVEPFLIASSLCGVVAERLIRVVCSECKEQYEPTELERSYFSFPVETLFRGKGCPRCNNTGYFGRIGIFELFAIEPGVLPLINSNTDSTAIKNYAIEHGMKTLRQDGLIKAATGQTSLQEVLRVTQKDDAGI
ncbi:MAG: type II secretion system ATPase GspE [Nitrospirae bacterium]|nr:type II secretion system ATPase GspE [Nitrospirota bacterium]MBF0533756.1 type II secretion system ATPase GspE [Nitrospirota bacterium]MBF0615535.1 type II secretion system ATPase GspE [Nitrospirota bacterium]